ncbi:radical SAM family heme chaperone HemW [Chloroflexota bacterium]
MAPNLALYVHIPFCRRKCGYCSFASYESNGVHIQPYLQALKSEITRRATNERLGSIYIGGGTPSLLTVAQFADLLAAIGRSFSLDETVEITVEVNPGTIDGAYLSALRGLGVNRLSLGVQSLDNGELRLLGRIHTAEDAIDSARCARAAGFTNVNFDLIYGMPGQSLLEWQNTLDEALVLAPEHLSLYSLTLEDETPMWKAVQDGSLPGIDADLAAEQYETAEDMLAEGGYRHYEISNWAKPGMECSHNMIYWQNRPYMGVGLAAHSWLENRRLANTGSLDEYLACFSEGLTPLPAIDEEISQETELAETVILGLRLGNGIRIGEVNRRFSVDIMARYGGIIGEMTDCGLLEYDRGRLKLTRRGRLLSNEVFWRFLPDNREMAIT